MVFKLDMRETKHLLGHQRCTLKSQKTYLYIHEMRTFDLWHLDLVGNNIPGLHSLSPEWVQKIYAKESLNVHNVKILSKKNSNVFGLFMPFFWEWKLALGILSDFPGIRSLSGLNGLNSLNDLSGLNDLNSLISSKNLLSMMLPLTWQ